MYWFLWSVNESAPIFCLVIAAAWLATNTKSNQRRVSGTCCIYYKTWHDSWNLLLAYCAAVNEPCYVFHVSNGCRWGLEAWIAHDTTSDQVSGYLITRWIRRYSRLKWLLTSATRFIYGSTVVDRSLRTDYFRRNHLNICHNYVGRNALSGTKWKWNQIPLLTSSIPRGATASRGRITGGRAFTPERGCPWAFVQGNMCLRANVRGKKERNRAFIAPFIYYVYLKALRHGSHSFTCKYTMPAFPSYAFTRWRHL